MNKTGEYLVKVVEVDGELYVPIPEALIERLNWKVGDKVDVSYDKKLDAIVVTKLQ